MKTLKKPLLPKYSYIPLLFCVILHFSVYEGTKLINGYIPAADVSLPIDAAIPLVPGWVFIYEFTFLFWAMGLIMSARQEKTLCYTLLGCFLTAELICLTFFLFLPTYVPRPELEVDGLASWMLSMIYSMDEPTNCFPSMHCLLTYLVFRQSLCCDNVKPWLKVFAGIVTVLVCLSTVFVKQHVVLDVIGGFACGEIAMQWGLRSSAWKIFDKLNKKLLPNA